MNRLTSLATFALLASCATTPSSGSTTPAPAAGNGKSNEPQKMAITNAIPFDTAACGPRELALAPITAEVLTGAMLSLSPATQECFVDITSRDGQAFDLKAKVTVADSGVTVEVSGAGASASGKACVEGVFKKLPLAALAAGAKPVSAEVPVGAGPQTVRMGDNAANDVVGTLRSSQLSLCECYAKLGDKAPPFLKADVEVVDGKTKITLPADELSTCLLPKLNALNLGTSPLKLTWPLLLKNSYASAVDSGAPAALQFQQYDGMRAQRTADVLISAGRRLVAALAYDDLAKNYKKKPSKGALDELKVKCADVGKGDDQQLAALKGLVAVLSDSQKLATGEKAKDAAWEAVESALGKQLETTTAEVVRVEKQKENDLNACPKVKF